MQSLHVARYLHVYKTADPEIVIGCTVFHGESEDVGSKTSLFEKSPCSAEVLVQSAIGKFKVFTAETGDGCVPC